MLQYINLILIDSPSRLLQVKVSRVVDDVIWWRADNLESAILDFCYFPKITTLYPQNREFNNKILNIFIDRPIKTWLARSHLIPKQFSRQNMSDGKINSHSESHQRNVEKVEGGGIYTPFPLSTQGGGGGLKLSWRLSAWECWEYYEALNKDSLAEYIGHFHDDHNLLRFFFLI